MLRYITEKEEGYLAQTKRKCVIKKKAGKKYVELPTGGKNLVMAIGLIVQNLELAELISDMTEEQVINLAMSILYQTTLRKKIRLKKPKSITTEEAIRIRKISNGETFFAKQDFYVYKDVEFISENEYKLRIAYEKTDEYELTARIHLKDGEAMFDLDDEDIDGLIKKRKSQTKQSSI